MINFAVFNIKNDIDNLSDTIYNKHTKNCRGIKWITSNGLRMQNLE